MLPIYIINKTFNLCIENFDQFILWLLMLALFGTVVTSACLSSFAPTLYYEIRSGKKQNNVMYFSIFDLQLPYRSTVFNEIILNISPKTQKIVTKSLKMDSIFMPFAYASVLLLIVYFYLHFEPYGSSTFPIESFLKYAVFLPVISYLCDIGENYLTKNLINRVYKMQQEEVGHKDERQEIETSLDRLVNNSKRKIYVASSLKWIIIFYCFLLIFWAFFLKIKYNL